MINKYKASEKNRYSVINEENIEIIDQIISELKQKGDSTGGVVECSVFGLDAGIGEPIFDGIENNIYLNGDGTDDVGAARFDPYSDRKSVV